MTNKVQKIKEWISKEQDGLMDANGNFDYPEHDGAYNILCNLDAYIYSLQEEPVSEDLEKMSYHSAMDLINNPKFLPTTTFGELIPMLQKLYKDGANWQKEKDESTTEDLGEYINELSKQFPEVSFAKLSRIAVRVAKWQREQDQSTIELAEDHAMLAGMNKMKEQMMAKAVDVEVKVDAGGYPYIPQMELYDYDTGVPLAKEGDRYKVIPIKEE